MNTLEQLKKAKEGEPKAVLVLDEMPEKCVDCDLCFECRDCIGRPDDIPYNIEKFSRTFSDARMPWCPLRKAIAIIQPDGHVDYLGEVEE